MLQKKRLRKNLNLFLLVFSINMIIIEQTIFFAMIKEMLQNCNIP